MSQQQMQTVINKKIVKKIRKTSKESSSSSSKSKSKDKKKRRQKQEGGGVGAFEEEYWEMGPDGQYVKTIKSSSYSTQPAQSNRVTSLNLQF